MVFALKSGGDLRTQTDVHDPGRDDRTFISGMPELQVHAPAKVSGLQHRTAPVAPLNEHQYRLGTKPWMSADHRLTIVLHHNRVPAVLRLHFERSLVRQVAEIHAAFDFASNNVPIYLIAQIIVRLKHYVYIVRPDLFASVTRLGSTNRAKALRQFATRARG